MSDRFPTVEPTRDDPTYARHAIVQPFAELPAGQRIAAIDTDSTDYTIARIGALLSAELQARDDSFEYFSVSVEITHLRPTRLHEPIGRCRWIACYAVTGGSEGHYVHVDRIYQDDRAREFQHEALYLCKTFGGWDRACQIAAYLGARLGA